MPAEKKSVHQIVTEKIIELLDTGVVPWRKPWREIGMVMPVSSRGYRYRGINVFILATQAMLKGFKSPVWLTYKQVQELGGTVRTGEKSTLVTFWKILKIEDRDSETNELKEKKVPLLRYYLVFNLDQTDDVKLKEKVQAIQDAATADAPKGGIGIDAAIEEAEGLIKGYENAPVIRYGGNRASYYPLIDEINIPNKEQFDSVEGWYATHFHEMGHSTGHKDRLNRQGVVGFDHFGSGQYAEEELVAEMTAAFLSAEAGINNTIENSAAYIASWKARLAADPKLIVQAAGKAQKAVDHITGKVFDNATS